MELSRFWGGAVVFLVLGLAGPVWGDVKLPAIFGDHMVLQGGVKLPIWGTADAGEKVTVTVGSETGSATAGADGKWQVALAPLTTSTTPVKVTVAGKNTLTFSDVLVGDVWVCSGQSNMEFGLGMEYNAKDEIPKANVPLVHLFLVPKVNSLTPQADIAAAPKQYPLQAHWVVCTPENVINVGGWNGFSAVGYYFGREIQKTTGQPVGLIGTYWGGTPAQSWTSLEKLQADPTLKHYADDLTKTRADYPQAVANQPAAQAAYVTNLAKWKQDNGLTAASTHADINAANAKDRAQGLPQMPGPPRPPDGGAHTPTCLYNGMIAPLIPYAIKGAIWYQGESNSGQVEYRTLFSAMITDWRARWGEGDFPFLFVQLAKYTDPNPGFAIIREAQVKTLALPNTGMASAVDIGDEKNIHPTDKSDVGLRLALAAKHVAYGQDLVYSGPVFEKEQIEGGAIRVSFTQVGGGLVIGTPPWTAPVPAPAPNAPPTPAAQPLSTTSLAGFTIAGADMNWVPADAKIDGNDVVISSAQVPQPRGGTLRLPGCRGKSLQQGGPACLAVPDGQLGRCPKASGSAEGRDDACSGCAAGCEIIGVCGWQRVTILPRASSSVVVRTRARY